MYSEKLKLALTQCSCSIIKDPFTGEYHIARSLLFQAIGVSYKGRKIAPTLDGTFKVGEIEYVLHKTKLGRENKFYSSARRQFITLYHKSSKHRLYVKCPDCVKLTPIGRLHQHAKVHRVFQIQEKGMIC